MTDHTTHACPTCGDVHLPPDPGPKTGPERPNVERAFNWVMSG